MDLLASSVAAGLVVPIPTSLAKYPPPAAMAALAPVQVSHLGESTCTEKAPPKSTELQSVGIVDFDVIVVYVRSGIVGTENVSRGQDHVTGDVEALAVAGRSKSEIPVGKVRIHARVDERTGIPNRNVSVGKGSHLGIGLRIHGRRGFPRGQSGRIGSEDFPSARSAARDLHLPRDFEPRARSTGADTDVTAGKGRKDRSIVDSVGHEIAAARHYAEPVVTVVILERDDDLTVVCALDKGTEIGQRPTVRRKEARKLSRRRETVETYRRSGASASDVEGTIGIRHSDADVSVRSDSHPFAQSRPALGIEPQVGGPSG